MTLLDAVRPASRRVRPARAARDASRETAQPRRVMTSGQFGLMSVVLAVLLAGTLALIFGPARGLRTDIVNVSDDLDASRDGIFLQLGTLRQQLDLAEQSLMVQEQGLQVAVEAEQDATTAAQATSEILVQTREALELVREVTASLGGVEQLGEKVDTVVVGVEQTLRVAQATLDVARQTLSTGQEALAVARDTLATLKRSEQVQLDLLTTARETLEQTRQINAKTPGVPVFPTTPPPAP